MLHFHLPVCMYWIKAVYENTQENGRLWPKTSITTSSECLISSAQLQVSATSIKINHHLLHASALVMHNPAGLPKGSARLSLHQPD
jgi:hypothetical protein